MMTITITAIVVLVLLGSVLALAEASISRMTRLRAALLRDEGYRNATILEKIESDPAPYLNAVYLSVMFAQNGSAILVAILAERHFGGFGVMALSVVFTIAYFVVVEDFRHSAQRSCRSSALGTGVVPRPRAALAHPRAHRPVEHSVAGQRPEK